MEVFKCAYKEIVDVTKLVPNPKNPNHHPQNQIEYLAKIIDFQGQRSPIVVSNRSGFIIKGHGRLLAMLRLGWKTVAVDYQDYSSEAEEYADLIADNKIAELAEHDDNMMIKDLKDMNFDLPFDLLGIPGFSFDPPPMADGSQELSEGDFQNFDHKCPKCNFEWDDNE